MTRALTAEDVKRRVDIVDVIARYTPLKRVRRSEWRGVEHPSLAVDQAKQVYYWHSRQEGGDVLAWLMHREGIDFAEALRRLADLASLRVAPLPRPEPEPPKPLPALDRVAQYERLLAQDRAAQAAWAREGFSSDDCQFWQFGYTPNCMGLGSALVIPVFYRGDLMCIKYRLLERDKDKYRSEGPSHLFHLDALDTQDEVWLVEGEKKAAYLTLRGFPAIGLPGVGTFKDEWFPAFAGKRIYIALDPPVNPYSVDYPAALSVIADVRLVYLPVKPDDFFLRYGGTPSQLEEIRRAARRMR